MRMAVQLALVQHTASYQMWNITESMLSRFAFQVLHNEVLGLFRILKVCTLTILHCYPQQGTTGYNESPHRSSASLAAH